MSEEFNKLNDEEKVKAENNFLKMKMMLEHGADIHFSSKGPPEVENDFLKYIMAFEKQSANPVYTTVFKKIGSPTHFKPAQEINETDIDQALDDLIEYINERGVDLSCCSPNISSRELYRFILEELFEKEINDIDIPGLTDCFIYDDFHPDHEYDNTRAAIDECIGLILSNEPFDFLSHFNRDNIQLNNHIGLSEESLKAIVNQFKELFSAINLQDAEIESCLINGNNCIVKGKYDVDLLTNLEKINIKDSWQVEFLFREDCGYWYIVNVQLGGINI